MYELVEKKRSPSSKDIFPTEAWEIISKNRKSDDLVILDVSTPKEYKDLHLEGAVNLNLFSRSFKAQLDIMNKNKVYVVYCKMGGRSKIARKLMQKSGFQTVYNIIGGVFLWEEEGLPFAAESDGVNKFSFCPFLISIITFKKIKRALHNAFLRIFQRKGIASSARVES